MSFQRTRTKTRTAEAEFISTPTSPPVLPSRAAGRLSDGNSTAKPSDQGKLLSPVSRVVSLGEPAGLEPAAERFTTPVPG